MDFTQQHFPKEAPDLYSFEEGPMKNPLKLIIGLVVALVFGVFFLMLKEGTPSQKMWDRVAQDLGLQYSNKLKAGMRMKGIINNLPVEVGSDTRDYNVLRLSVRVQTQLPPHILLDSGTDSTLVAKLTQRESTVSTGDEAFDEQFHVWTTNPKATIAFLSPKRRAALKEATKEIRVRIKGGDTIGLYGDFTTRDERKLRAVIQRTVELATALRSPKRADP